MDEGRMEPGTIPRRRNKLKSVFMEAGIIAGAASKTMPIRDDGLSRPVTW
jgi:hypothetical protein